MKSFVILLVVGLASAPAHALVNGNGVIFAAASLKGPMDRAIALMIREQRCVAAGKTIRVSYASSGILARQIRFGAPADLFVTADPVWLDDLRKRKMIEDLPAGRRILFTNRLVLIGARKPVSVTNLSAKSTLADRFGRARLAIGDPGHVPAGRYAKAALEAMGLWAKARRKLVLAANVRVALAYVARREAPLGIVYRTDALADPTVHIVADIPARTHPPIRYTAAVVTGGNGRCARRWADAFHSASIQKIFAAAGYGLPTPAR